MSFNSNELTLVEAQVDCSNNNNFESQVTLEKQEPEITEAESTWLESLFAEEQEEQEMPNDPVMNDTSINAMNNIINH